MECYSKKIIRQIQADQNGKRLGKTYYELILYVISEVTFRTQGGSEELQIKGRR